MSDFNANAITQWFGNDLRYKEVNEDGSDLSTPDTWHQLGHRDEGQFIDKPEFKEITAEDGSVVKKVEEIRKPTGSGNVLQSDKATLDFLRKGCRDKFYAIWWNLGKVDGKQQELLVPVAQFTPGLELVAGTRKPPYEFVVLKNDADITFAKADMSFSNMASDTTVSAGDYYEIIEN